MTNFIKGSAEELSKYLGPVGSMQEWLPYESRKAVGKAMKNMDARGVLAIDDRHRLVGSFFYYPSLNDPIVQGLADKFPFDITKAFTVAMVWVHKSTRGQGLGRAMFEQVQEGALDAGFTVRLGYGSPGEDIWGFAAAMSDNATYIEDLEYNGMPFRYTKLLD